MEDYKREFYKKLPEDMDFDLQQQWKKYFLRKDAILVGMALLIFLAVQNILGVIAAIPSLVSVSQLTDQLIQTFVYVLSMGIPFFILFFVSKRDKTELISAEIPKPHTFWPVILMGIGCIPVLQFAAGYFDQLLSLVKLDTYQPLLDAAFSPVTDTGALIVQFICTSLLAAIFEEFAFRGVILQILRRYGNTFAIVTSALMFGLIHGNTYQIPFAFLFGLVLGAAAVYTGSLWTPVLLHLINNMVAFGLNIVAERFGDQAGDVATYIAWGAFFLLGAAAAIFVAATAKKSAAFKNERQPYELSGKKKGYGIFFKAPTIIISIVLMALTAFFMTTLVQDWVNSIVQYADLL
ncbi:MAG TPA: type II CAAX endopeptidase family protein [Oscillospiraceae bacterium]|nr:type II CAAX endopeptidase family protein [Oscillospiraceae bacterium]HPF56181.1 type II CAAX endopeptidase family protein [Clostridiales bacterium]HPK36480.1 type II CAAX endopeptidase family protein [Oscillospiraceae bacterium]